MVAVRVHAIEGSEALAKKLALGLPLVSDADRALTEAFGLYDGFRRAVVHG